MPCKVVPVDEPLSRLLASSEGSSRGRIRSRLRQSPYGVKFKSRDNSKGDRNNSVFEGKLQKDSKAGSRFCFHPTIPLYKRFVNTFIIYVIFLVGHCCYAQDDLRCFLLKGGSVQNFFVPESLPIGSVIGKLNIGGDPSENGDIYLRLEEDKISPVHIDQFSKKLILTGKLDKEGKEGVSHVVINVICQKRKMNDVDTRIPINIRVTDANDNSPSFIDAPYYVNVSEATVVGTKIVGEIRAVDNDQKGPYSTVQYSIAHGPNSDKFAFQSPIGGDLQLLKPLDYETDPLFNLSIVAEDQGIPPLRTETYLTVQVLDSDDQNPAFRRQRYMAFLPDQPVKGKALEVQPEPLRAEDQDKGIMARIYYSLGTGVQEATYFTIEPNTGDVFLLADAPEGAFTQPVALIVKATQVDNQDREASAILMVSRRGTVSPQLQFLQRVYDVTVLENLPVNSLIVSTIINKSSFKNVRFYLQGGGLGTFKVSETGSVLSAHRLDYERHNEYHLEVSVSDGEFNDTAYLIVRVLNVNDWDPRFQYPQYAFHISKTAIDPGDIIGNVTVADGDNDHISLSVGGRDARMFDITSAGEILIRRRVELNSTEAHIILMAKDTGEPPRQTSVPVTVHFPAAMVQSAPIRSSSSFLLMVVFGSLVAVFTLVIICLVVYIQKNRKYRDDSTAALPTKMKQIITNGVTTSKVGPLTPIGAQADDRSSLTGVEAPRSTGAILETNNPFKRSYANGNLRCSTSKSSAVLPTCCSMKVSVESHGQSSNPSGSRRYLRNPLAMGASLGGGDMNGAADGGDSLSLNGSSETTTSTATAGSDSSPNNCSRSSTPCALTRILGSKQQSSIVPNVGSFSSFSTYDGTARATGGIPSQSRVIPTPPMPPVPPPNANRSFKPSCDGPSTSGIVSGRKCASSPSRARRGKKVLWPPEAVPKKVKKLSWEDERERQTEMNPEVSVTPMPPQKTKEAPNLTVYF